MDRTFNFKIKNGTNISFSSTFQFDYFALSMFPMEFSVELFGIKAGSALIEGIDLGREKKDTNQLLTSITFDFNVDLSKYDFNILFDFVDKALKIEGKEKAEVKAEPKSVDNWQHKPSRRERRAKGKKGKQ